MVLSQAAFEREEKKPHPTWDLEILDWVGYDVLLHREVTVGGVAPLLRLTWRRRLRLHYRPSSHDGLGDEAGDVLRVHASRLRDLLEQLLRRLRRGLLLLFLPRTRVVTELDLLGHDLGVVAPRHRAVRRHDLLVVRAEASLDEHLLALLAEPERDVREGRPEDDVEHVVGAVLRRRPVDRHLHEGAVVHLLLGIADGVDGILHEPSDQSHLAVVHDALLCSLSCVLLVKPTSVQQENYRAPMRPKRSDLTGARLRSH